MAKCTSSIGRTGGVCGDDSGAVDRGARQRRSRLQTLTYSRSHLDSALETVRCTRSGRTGHPRTYSSTREYRPGDPLKLSRGPTQAATPSGQRATIHYKESGTSSTTTLL